MWNPLSWVMILVAIFALVVVNGGGQPPEWEVSLGIILLLLANSAIGFIGQRKAYSAVSTLMKPVALEAKVKRNGQWEVIDSAGLVPDDIIAIKVGDVIPADARVIGKEMFFNRKQSCQLWIYFSCTWWGCHRSSDSDW